MQQLELHNARYRQKYVTKSETSDNAFVQIKVKDSKQLQNSANRNAHQTRAIHCNCLSLAHSRAVARALAPSCGWWNKKGPTRARANGLFTVIPKRNLNYENVSRRKV